MADSHSASEPGGMGFQFQKLGINRASRGSIVQKDISTDRGYFQLSGRSVSQGTAGRQAVHEKKTPGLDGRKGIVYVRCRRSDARVPALP